MVEGLPITREKWNFTSFKLRIEIIICPFEEPQLEEIVKSYC